MKYRGELFRKCSDCVKRTCRLWGITPSPSLLADRGLSLSERCSALCLQTQTQKHAGILQGSQYGGKQTKQGG